MDANANDPPPLPTLKPPPIGVVPPPVDGSPSIPPPIASPKSFSLRRLVAVLLSLFLLLFMADALICLLDDSLILFLHAHVLGGLRGIVFLFAILAAIVIYGLMGLTPMIPKRYFLPLTLFTPIAGLALLPLLIYFYDRSQWLTWLVSISEVIVGLSILQLLRRASKQKAIEEDRPSAAGSAAQLVSEEN